MDRSVLGIVAKAVPYYLDPGWDNAVLERAEDELAQTPCHAGKQAHEVVFRDQKAPELLAARWAR